MKTEQLDLLAGLKKIAPECFYQFKYPYSFKFDLILDSKNYGNLEVVVKKGREIAEIKGSKTAIKKLNEINKDGSNDYWEIPPDGERIMHYPVIYIDELASLLGQYCFFSGKNVKFEPNGEFNKVIEFLKHRANPIDTVALFEKTGDLIIDG